MFGFFDDMEWGTAAAKTIAWASGDVVGNVVFIVGSGIRRIDRQWIARTIQFIEGRGVDTVRLHRLAADPQLTAQRIVGKDGDADASGVTGILGLAGHEVQRSRKAYVAAPISECRDFNCAA